MTERQKVVQKHSDEISFKKMAAFKLKKRNERWLKKQKAQKLQKTLLKFAGNVGEVRLIKR